MGHLEAVRIAADTGGSDSASSRRPPPAEGSGRPAQLDEGEGTKVTWHQEMESLKGLFKFADPIVLKMYARDVRSNLEKVKTILEGVTGTLVSRCTRRLRSRLLGAPRLARLATSAAPLGLTTRR